MIFSPFAGNSKGRIEEFVILLALNRVGGQSARKGTLEITRAGKIPPTRSDLTWAGDLQHKCEMLDH